MIAMMTSRMDSTSSIRKPINVNGSANGPPSFMPIKPVLQSTTNNPGVAPTNADCKVVVTGVAAAGDDAGGDMRDQRR